MLNRDIEQSIQDYLQDLALALSGQDIAVIQDAQFDTEQHFRAALEEADDPSQALPDIIKSYGSVQDIAQSYREMESTVNWALYGKQNQPKRTKFGGIFSIFKDMQAYRALAYMALTLPIGIAYFAWIMLVGLGTAVASIFIIGMPFFLLFLKSMQYFSLFEGRLIESLLGKRMPRRPKYLHELASQSYARRIMALVKYRQSWTSILYLALKLPIGMLNFFAVIVPIVFSVAIILSPIIDPIAHAINPTITVDLALYWFPLSMPVGVLGLIVSLHLAKFLGSKQADLAKHMLVQMVSK